MSFFQNPFSNEFRGNWVLGDRGHSPVFQVAPNTGRGQNIVQSFNIGPFDMSGNDVDGNSELDLTYSWAIDPEYKKWATHTVTISPASSSSVNVREIVVDLNGDSVFSSFFTASVTKFTTGEDRLTIKTDKDLIKFFIHNGKAETLLGINARAGVAEAPAYFDRHRLCAYDTTAGEPILTNDRWDFSDSAAMLVGLDPANSDVDVAVIDNATDHHGNSLNLDSSTIQDDWQLLKGRSGMFEFQSGPSAGAVAATLTTIIYPAGAVAGDLAKMIVDRQDASGDTVEKFSMPYRLLTADLITPP